MTLIDLRDLVNKSGASYDSGDTDTLYAEDYTPLKDALQSGTTEIVCKANKIIFPDSGNLVVYATDGTTELFKIDTSGNVYVKGRVISL